MSESDREERIRQRAHQIYLERGDRPGDDLEDWLAAEGEEDPLFYSTKYAPLEDAEAPKRDDAQTAPGSTEDASTGGAPGRGTMSEGQPQESAPSSNPEGETKDDKINEAVEESFPASDAPAWRGGSGS
jgi:hypothetical protein